MTAQLPPVAVQMYTLRDHVDVSLAATLDRLRELGATAVEPYGFDANPTEYARALDAAGLCAWSAHASVLDAADPDRVIDAALTIGAQLLIEPVMREPHWGSADAVERLADRMSSLAARAAAHGLRFGYHNHHWELQTLIDGRPALEHLAARTEGVELEIDAYWAAFGGADVPELLRALRAPVTLLHLKDGPVVRDITRQVALGDGVMDIPAVVHAAPAAGWVVELDGFDGDIWDPVARSLRYVEGLHR